MTLYAVIHGIPTKQIVRYATVPSTASAGVDITATIGRTMQRKNAIIAAETIQNKITVLPMVCEIFFLFFAPTACPMVTVVPIASPTIITVSICITWLPTETAVVLATPSNCPTMNRPPSHTMSAENKITGTEGKRTSGSSEHFRL